MDQQNCSKKFQADTSSDEDDAVEPAAVGVDDTDGARRTSRTTGATASSSGKMAGSNAPVDRKTTKQHHQSSKDKKPLESRIKEPIKKDLNASLEKRNKTLGDNAKAALKRCKQIIALYKPSESQLKQLCIIEQQARELSTKLQKLASPDMSEMAKDGSSKLPVENNYELLADTAAQYASISAESHQITTLRLIQNWTTDVGALQRRMQQKIKDDVIRPFLNFANEYIDIVAKISTLKKTYETLLKLKQLVETLMASSSHDRETLAHFEAAIDELSATTERLNELVESVRDAIRPEQRRRDHYRLFNIATQHYMEFCLKAADKISRRVD